MTMTSNNSEARKRQEALERAPELVRQSQRRREVLRDALAEVWSGADFIDADAVLDHLSDRGARIEVLP